MKSDHGTSGLTRIEELIAVACREVGGHQEPIGPNTTVNFDLGIAGDDADELAGEIIAATGLAIDPAHEFPSYFGSDGMLDLLHLSNGRRLKPLTVRQLAGFLRGDPKMADEQLRALNAFWGRNWAVRAQGSSSTSQ